MSSDVGPGEDRFRWPAGFAYIEGGAENGAENGRRLDRATWFGAASRAERRVASERLRLRR